MTGRNKIDLKIVIRCNCAKYIEKRIKFLLKDFIKGNTEILNIKYETIMDAIKIII